MENLNIFLSGVAGAFVIYILMYRETRINEFLKNPGEKWMLVIVDFFLFLTAGGLVAMFALSKPTAKEAFIAGISWQGVVGGLFSSLEYTKLREQYKKLNSKFSKNLKNQEAFRLRALREATAFPDEDDEIQIAPAE